MLIQTVKLHYENEDRISLTRLLVWLEEAIKDLPAQTYNKFIDKHFQGDWINIHAFLNRLTVTGKVIELDLQDAQLLIDAVTFLILVRGEGLNSKPSLLLLPVQKDLSKVKLSGENKFKAA